MRTNGNFDLHLLSEAPYGAYAVDMSQTILFWNRSAERILGHTADEVIGLRCCQVLQGLLENGTTLVCAKGCTAVRYARAGQFPAVTHVMARCASGQRKPITITPLIVPQTHDAQPVLVNLFHEWVDARTREAVGVVQGAPLRGMSSGESAAPAADPAFREVSPLTARELDVLRLLSLDMETGEIVDHLNLSHHTVRNYIRNAREKLRARSKLSAVLTAQRLGLI